jgi:hypothetical protein
MTDKPKPTVESLHNDVTALAGKLQMAAWLITVFGALAVLGATWVVTTTLRTEERSIYILERIEAHGGLHGHPPLHEDVRDIERDLSRLQSGYASDLRATRLSIQKIESALERMAERRRTRRR